MKKNNKSLLSRFFSHDITLLVLAFLVAFLAWFYISANSQTKKTITDIPITIELSDEAQEEGLKVFTNGELKGSVDVTGNRITVGSLTSEDIAIVANEAGSINTTGTYTLTLAAKQIGIRSNYTFDSDVSPPTVTVYVDKENSETFTIKNKVSVSTDDSHYANVVMSKDKVMVTGPEKLVSQIAYAAVVDNIENVKDGEMSVPEKIEFFDENDKKIELSYLTTDIESVDVSITILPVEDIDLKVDVTNAPSNAPDYSILPESVRIAGPQDTLDGIKDGTISVGTLDFSKLTNDSENKQTYELKLPDGCKTVGGEKSAEVTIDLSDYTKTSVTGKIKGKLDSDSYKTEFDSSTVEITIYGPELLTNTISSSDVTVSADFSGLLDDLKSGNSTTVTVPLKVSLDSDYAECWVYGTYNVKATVTKK